MPPDRKPETKEIPKQKETPETQELTRIKQALGRVSRTKDGKDVIRYIMHRCGFKTPSVVANPTTGEIYTDSTVYNEARRNLYLELRSLIPKEELNLIEMEV